ncbi:MAG: hypothetical protein HETSPECPRED_000470 [Heterodermia speciosa]|uniref:DUF2423 domain-containing protein n=1 Tax=Heterodermia speciosa TaxID=116794 RepID=A0A8H3EUX2_9LECA|nr:MAG: hypothetical protein HETSPECPRED_000470 [Heterodermia speciosa]
MAKGLRSSRVKTNKSKLRAQVFGPVEDARKERLSAQLLEIASRPRASTDSDTKMVQNDDETPFSKSEMATGTNKKDEAMDIDQDAGVKAKQPAHSSRRIQKRVRYKAKSSMVFPIYKQGKKVRPRTKARK